MLNKMIGQLCKSYRIKLGYLQKDVAKDVGYTTENISSFENGRNDNSLILIWYLLHGLTIENIREVIYDDGRRNNQHRH